MVMWYFTPEKSCWSDLPSSPSFPIQIFINISIQNYILRLNKSLLNTELDCIKVH